MSLWLKSNGALSEPTPGGVLLRGLGVEGVVARYHARSLIGEDDTDVPAMLDMSGNGRDLSLTTGVARINIRSGVRTVSLAGGGALQSAVWGQSLSRTLVLSGYFANSPASTVQFFASYPSAGVQIAALPTGTFAAYGVGGGFPVSAVIAKPAWLRLIATIDKDTLDAKITVNGVTVAGAIALSGSLTQSAMITLQQTTAMGFEFVEAALVNHVCDADEIAAIDAALHAELPV